MSEVELVSGIRFSTIAQELGPEYKHAAGSSLECLVVKHEKSSALIALHGAHVLQWQPNGQQPVLWLSKESHFIEGKAIRGGVPVCWPWFAGHKIHSDWPAHGLVRQRIWTVQRSEKLSDGTLRIVLEIAYDESEATYTQPYQAQIIIECGESLLVRLETKNLGEETMRCESALHSYFTISQVDQAQVIGLDGARYYNTVGGGAVETQQAGPIFFDQEIDRSFQDSTVALTLVDAGLQRKILVEKDGSDSTVVWNPWIDKAARMADFGDEEYRGMLCIEAANCFDNVVEIPAGETRHIETRISIAS